MKNTIDHIYCIEIQKNKKVYYIEIGTITHLLDANIFLIPSSLTGKNFMEFKNLLFKQVNLV